MSPAFGFIRRLAVTFVVVRMSECRVAVDLSELFPAVA